ncbi:MAG: hypothetical protein QOE77_1543 [Blastocatellia bacterium]|jgi:hypothetical protein|nr:hypothetical protein [Blastocatellia bacterium]
MSLLEKFPTGSLLPLLVFAAALSIFLLSPVHQVTDSGYSMMLSESLLHQRSFALDHYAIPRGEPKWFRYYYRNGDIYQLEWVNGRLYYNFPPGASVLSIPFVAIMNAAGISAVRADGAYDPVGEETIEKILAALLMAALVCLFFYQARLVLPDWLSLLVAFGGGLGTQVWSTASRNLWSETWGIFLLGLVLLMLLGAATERWRLRPILLATLLSWMYIVRPTFAVHIIGITIYILLYYRAALLRFAITGAVWLAAFMTFSWHYYGHLLPSYFRAGRLQFDFFGTALAANLFSPARGLLIYVPIVFFLGYLLIRYWRHIVYSRLAFLSLAVIAAHMIVISCLVHWWAGHSFGARLSTGLVPWFVLLAILGLQARSRSREEWHRLQSVKPSESVHRLKSVPLIELVAGSALLLLSVVINGLGATSQATWRWNTRPVNIDDHPERNWDWRQPQFLAAFVNPPLPAKIGQVTSNQIDAAGPSSAQFIWYGWSPPENASRWSEDTKATLVFELETIEALQFAMRLHAFVIPLEHPQQRLTIKLNGTVIQTQVFENSLAQEVSFPLPSELLRSRNVMEFELPDAISPQSLHRGEDSRRLGVAVYWIQFKQKASVHLQQSL